MTNNYSLKKWEVWKAIVEFEGSEGFKERPVLIFDPNPQCIKALVMTSHAPRKNFPGEYQIKHREWTRLTKETVVRCSKMVKLRPEDLSEPWGRLHPVDINEIMNILSEMGY